MKSQLKVSKLILILLAGLFFNQLLNARFFYEGNRIPTSGKKIIRINQRGQITNSNSAIQNNTETLQRNANYNYDPRVPSYNLSNFNTTSRCERIDLIKSLQEAKKKEKKAKRKKRNRIKIKNEVRL